MQQIVLTDGTVLTFKSGKAVRQTPTELKEIIIMAGGWNTFVRRFDPILVSELYPHIGGSSYLWDSSLIKECNPAHIWTLVDCEGTLRIQEGWHLVNRLGYIIARNPRLVVNTGGVYKQYNF